MKASFKALATVFLAVPCVLGVAVAPSTTVADAELEVDASSGSATASAAQATCGTAFKFTGVNESGAEFGNTNIPGTLGKDYTWPSPSSIDFFMKDGMNAFRIPFQLERLVPPSGGITGSFDQTYLNGLKTIVNYITGKGGYALIDPHNFMIYNGGQITDCNAFSTLWTHLSTEFKSNSHVIFDLMNEPNGIAASQVFQCMQAAVTAIRNNGATQLIMVEGTAWTGAWSWTTSSGNAQAFAALKDPLNNIAIEMHQYLDSDSSGTSATCVSSTIGSERIAAATTWLQQHGFKGFLGEIGAGNNDQCVQAVKGALCDMQKSGVWLGFLFWAAGPWWGTYFQSIEPPSGAALQSIYPNALKPFIG